MADKWGLASPVQVTLQGEGYTVLRLYTAVEIKVWQLLASGQDS